MICSGTADAYQDMLQSFRVRSVAVPTIAAVVVLVVALLVRNQPAAAPAQAATPVVSKARQVAVALRMYAFGPTTLTVSKGTRVTWVNHDATAHTATANNGAFDTGTINPGKRKTLALTKPGTYVYHCAFHAFMTAKITVKP